MDESLREIPTDYAVAEEKRRSFLVDLFIRLVREKPLGTVGGVIVLLLLITGIFSNFLAPHGFNESLGVYRSPPSATYLMGTDNLGRDMLSRVIYGARISVIVGLSASALSVLVSTIIGIFCGFLGGKFDLVVQRFVDAWMCFPGLVILIVVVSIIGPSMGGIIIVLGLQYGIAGSRVIRGSVIGIKGNMYVEAARSTGCSTPRILVRHILPNIMAPLIILFTTRMPAIILAEASLSFLGYGIPPPTPSWGGMLSGPGRSNMLIAPWMAIWPGLALSIVVYGVNMFGDAVRDLLDPRLRGGLGRYSGVKVKMKKSQDDKEQLSSGVPQK